MNLYCKDVLPLAALLHHQHLLVLQYLLLQDRFFFPLESLEHLVYELLCVVQKLQLLQDQTPVYDPLNNQILELGHL